MHFIVYIFVAVSLAPSVQSLRSQSWSTPHAAKYNKEGYVVFNEKGTIGKLCTANLNVTLPETEINNVLQTAASSLCTLLTYGYIFFLQKSILCKLFVDTFYSL